MRLNKPALALVHCAIAPSRNLITQLNFAGFYHGLGHGFLFEGRNCEILREGFGKEKQFTQTALESLGLPDDFILTLGRKIVVDKYFTAQGSELGKMIGWKSGNLIVGWNGHFFLFFLSCSLEKRGDRSL